MGLDHWLTREIDIGGQYIHNSVNVEELKFVKKDKEYLLPTKNIDSIKYEIISWRKSNHIHNWFVDNVQGGNDNCEEHFVSFEKLLEFIDVLKKVNEIKNQIELDNTSEPEDKVYNNIKVGLKEELEKLLPTQTGFFFGNGEYQNWYFSDVEEALELLEEELRFKEKNKELYISYRYGSSW